MQMSKNVSTKEFQHASEQWMSHGIETSRECLMLPKRAEDDDCNTERANRHAVPNCVY